MEKVLVATDGSDHANTAVLLAGDLAAKYGARLIVLHILLVNIDSEVLRKLISPEVLPDDLRALLDSYEDDFLMAMGGTGAGFVNIPAPRELVERLGQQILEQSERIAREAGVEDVSTMMVEGDPADSILDCAAFENANMIVLGSRGLSDFKGFFLGSVSHKVSSQAECTCVTVK